MTTLTTSTRKEESERVTLSAEALKARAMAESEVAKGIAERKKFDPMFSDLERNRLGSVKDEFEMYLSARFKTEVKDLFNLPKVVQDEVDRDLFLSFVQKICTDKKLTSAKRMPVSQEIVGTMSWLSECLEKKLMVLEDDRLSITLRVPSTLSQEMWTLMNHCIEESNSELKLFPWVSLMSQYPMKVSFMDSESIASKQAYDTLKKTMQPWVSLTPLKIMNKLFSLRGVDEHAFVIAGKWLSRLCEYSFSTRFKEFVYILAAPDEVHAFKVPKRLDKVKEIDPIYTLALSTAVESLDLDLSMSMVVLAFWTKQVRFAITRKLSVEDLIFSFDKSENSGIRMLKIDDVLAHSLVTVSEFKFLNTKVVPVGNPKQIRSKPPAPAMTRRNSKSVAFFEDRVAEKVDSMDVDEDEKDAIEPEYECN